MSNRTKVVCAVIRNEAGAYLATQRGSGHYEGLWEFPGGKVEPEESIAEATERAQRRVGGGLTVSAANISGVAELVQGELSVH